MTSINLSRPTLDDVFLTMTGRSLRDDSASAAAGTDPGSAGPDASGPDAAGPGQSQPAGKE
jgi:hypothetical protein